MVLKLDPNNVYYIIVYSIFKISSFVKPLINTVIKKSTLLLLLLFFLFAGSNKCLSQTKVIDSLKLVVSTSSDHVKVKTLLSIANEYMGINYDSVVVYGNKALDNALSLKDNNLVIEALVNLAYINFSVGNNERSIFLYDQAKQLCIKENNNYYLALIYFDLERYYSSLSDYDGVLHTLDTALSIINENNIASLKPEVYRKIGRLFLSIHDYPGATYYAKLAINISKNDSIKTSYTNNLILMGNILLKKNEYDSSLYYYTKALSIAKKYNDRISLQQAYRELSHFYMDIKDYNNSKLYIDTTIYYSKELHLINEEASLITYVAHIYALEEDYTNALMSNLQALELRNSTGGKSAICASLLNIGGSYTKLYEFKEAKLYLRKGLILAKELKKVKYIAYAYEKLSELYKLEGSYKKALEFTELKVQYNDSISTWKTTRTIRFFRHQYEAEKEKTLSERIKLEKKDNEVIFLFVTIILALGIIILLALLNYLRKKSTKEIIKLSRIIETTNQSVVLIDNNSIIVYVNNGLLKMLGFSNKNELIGRSIFEFTNSVGKKLLNDEMLPALLDVGHWHDEITYKRKDESFFISEEICSVIYDKNDKPKFYVAIFNDISKRKEAESALKTSRELLEKTVKTQDKMFSIIAHDLTGPFSSILGLSELMAKEYDHYQKEDHIRFSQLIYNSSKNTFELLTNLLHWSRSQLGNIELKKENINLYDMVSKTLEPLTLMVSKKEITIHNEISQEFKAFIDNNTISVVIRNLLTNAIKFTPRRGTINVTATKTKSNITLTVSDTGSGIEAEDIISLFDINNITSKEGTENEKGTGLGLILCKEFTELNNGTITVDSIYGKGSNFILSLPAD